MTALIIYYAALFISIPLYYKKKEKLGSLFQGGGAIVMM